MSTVRPVLRAAAPLAALALLNASLTFYDAWPTPKVEWYGHLSLELAGAVLLLVLTTWLGRERAAGCTVRGLAALWLALVVGRYVDVMAPSLYGRPVNLYWDARHLAAVTAMMTDALSAPAIALGVAALAGALALMFGLARWALATIADASRRPAARVALIAAALAVVVQFSVQTIAGRIVPLVGVAPPVLATYWHQARLLARQFGAEPARLAASHPALNADLGRVRGADVLLVFMESYGAVTLDRPEVALPITASRDGFATDVAATGRGIVSAMVDSPTFGGASWLAHVSLMTGVEARDEGTNSALMSQPRDTLVSTFARAGYRTVALMPGLRHPWPEGAFYGFDTIYGTAALGYAGPHFGWWEVPDQFALARVDQLEAARAGGPPLFLFFPTTSTHAPFAPTAPYQPDWPRVVSAEPYADADVRQALAFEPDYFNLTPSYVSALTTSFATLGGYLRRHPTRDLVLVLIGDHQPAAVVAGEGASWDVPVHVVASRPEVLAALVAHGFSTGATPARRALSPMHALLPTLLASFGDGPSRPAPRAADARPLPIGETSQ